MLPTIWRLLPINECKHSVKVFGSCILDNRMAIQWCYPMIKVLDAFSVRNGSEFRVWCQFRVGTEPGPTQHVSTENPLVKCQHFILQLSIWVLILSQHNVYARYAVWCPLSSPHLRFEIGSIFIKSTWQAGHFGEILPSFHSDSTNINPISNLTIGHELGHPFAQFMYRSCCDMIRIQILNCSQSCWNSKIEPQTGSNPFLNPEGTPALRVTTPTGLSNPVPNLHRSWVTWNLC